MEIVKDMTGWRSILLEWKDLAIHIFPDKDDWIWGYQEDWYDGPIAYFGVGPLLLFCWFCL